MVRFVPPITLQKRHWMSSYTSGVTFKVTYWLLDMLILTRF